MKRFAFILALTFLAACSQTYKISVRPELYVNPSDIGGQQNVGFKVVDRRKNKNVGEGRGRLAKFKRYTIIADSNLAETIETPISGGLEEMGFRVEPFAQKQGPKLRVDILKFKDEYTEKISSITKIYEKLSVALRANCVNGKKKYLNIYSAVKKETHGVVSANFPNEKLVNSTLSLVLQEMFEDKKLIACLAGK